MSGKSARIGLTCLFGLGVLSSVFLSNGIAMATSQCQTIQGKYMIVGEADYRTKSSSYDDAAYANSWWSGESIDAPSYSSSNQWIGGANSSATDLHFLIYVNHTDETGSDSSDVTFELELRYSSTKDAYGCPTSYSTMSTTQYIDTYTGGGGFCSGNSCNTWAGKLLGFHNLSYYKAWKSITSVSGPETDASDYGCWVVADQTQCTLVDY